MNATIKPGGLLDRVALPDYPPYHGNAKCKDWLKGEK